MNIYVKTWKWLVFPLVFAVLLSLACGKMTGAEIIADPDSPEVQANGGQPVFYPPAGCTEPTSENRSWINTDEKISWCKSGYSGNVTVLDAAMIASIASPWPGDEEIVGIVWAGSKVIKLVLVATAAYETARIATDYVGEHSSAQHDPSISDSNARILIATLISTWAATGGPDPNKNRCFELIINEIAERLIYWTFTGVSTSGIDHGDLAWYDLKGNTWGGAYPNKSSRTLGNVPKDVAGEFPNSRMVEVNCGNYPPPALK